jgi:hypothetical protein
MRFFSPLLLKRCEFLLVRNIIAHAPKSPVVIELEKHGNQTIIPIRTLRVYENSFESIFMPLHASLYVNYVRDCELRYLYRDDGALLRTVSKDDMKLFVTSHDIHITTLKTSADLKYGDMLLCNGASNAFA